MKFIKFITCFVLRHLVIAILYYIGLHTALSWLYIFFDLADHNILFTEDLEMDDSRPFYKKEAFWIFVGIVLVITVGLYILPYYPEGVILPSRVEELDLLSSGTSASSMSDTQTLSVHTTPTATALPSPYIDGNLTASPTSTVVNSSGSTTPTSAYSSAPASPTLNVAWGDLEIINDTPQPTPVLPSTTAPIVNDEDAFFDGGYTNLFF